MELMFLMGLLGWATHVLKVMVELRKHDPQATLREMLENHPYQLAGSITATLGLCAAAYEMGELTMATAFMVGYMADSLLEPVGRRIIKVMG